MLHKKTPPFKSFLLYHGIKLNSNIFLFAFEIDSHNAADSRTYQHDDKPEKADKTNRAAADNERHE